MGDRFRGGEGSRPDQCGAVKTSLTRRVKRRCDGLASQPSSGVDAALDTDPVPGSLAGVAFFVSIALAAFVIARRLARTAAPAEGAVTV